MASESEWNLRVWVVGVVVRRNIDNLIFLIPSPPASVFFAATSFSFVKKKEEIFVLVSVLFCNDIL